MADLSRKLTLVVTLLLLAVAGATTRAQKNPPTNLVLIVTDNHGAWTLGCYGNEEIQTQHLDRMAADGVRFARAFANNPVCSPTRATILTGLMPSQHGVHNYLNARYNTLAEFASLPQILSKAGYTCGIVGKWHLGRFDDPGQEGFSHWLAKKDGHTISFHETEVCDQTGKRQTIRGHVTPFWTKHAVRFIEQNKQRPFFLYLAYNGPYGLSQCIRGKPQNAHAATYADRPMKSFPREKMHPWLRRNNEHVNNLTSMRNYASQVSLVDEGVGQVLAALEKHGLDKNTLVVFLGDQGMAGGHGGFWGMGDHTRPRSMYDWTLHIPLIMRHPGKLPRGKTVEPLVANYDLYPTLLAYLGLGDQIPDQPPRPGRNLLPLIRGQADDWENVVVGEYGEWVRMIRTDRWKLILRPGEGPHELFDLTQDPSEQRNLFKQADPQEQQRELKERLEKFFATYSTPKWNMWQGGTSKHLHTKRRPE